MLSFPNFFPLPIHALIPLPSSGYSYTANSLLNLLLGPWIAIKYESLSTRAACTCFRFSSSENLRLTSFPIGCFPEMRPGKQMLLAE